MTIRPHTEHIGRLEEEAGCFVLLTNVPTAGNLAHSAREILTVYKEQHGTEQNYGSRTSGLRIMFRDLSRAV